MSTDRRSFLRQLGIGGSAFILGSSVISAAGCQPADETGTGMKGIGFSLPGLPYAYNALEPVIDEQTMPSKRR